MRRRRKKPPLSSNGKNAACAYCNRQLEATTANSAVRATRDHVKPKSRGGTYRVWACATCNSMKADKTPHEWAAFMLAYPQWWKKENLLG